MYSIDDRSNIGALDISIDSIQRDVSDNTLLGLLASASNEPELYQLRTTMASSPPQTVSDTKFWTYVASAHIMWLETINIFGSSCPSIRNEFMLIDELQYNVCKKFSQFLVEHFKDLTLVNGEIRKYSSFSGHCEKLNELLYKFT